MASMLWTMTHACAHFNYGSSRLGGVQSGACSRSSPAPPARPARRIIDRLTAADRPVRAASARHRVRLGGPLDVAGRARRRRRRVHRLLPRPRVARRGGDRRRVRSARRAPRACSGWCCCRAVASPRPCAPSSEVAAAGVPLTVVRCSWFMQNFTESFMAEGVERGVVALPAGHVPEPFVDVEDIADVAFAALTEDGHAGEVYELTGPRALRIDEAVAELAAAVRPRPALRADHARGLPRDRAARARRLRRLPLHGAARRPQRADPGRRASARSAGLRGTSPSSPTASRRGRGYDRRHAREPGHRRAVHVHRGHAGAARVRLRAARGRQGADPARPCHPDRALRGRRGRGAVPARAAVRARAPGRRDRGPARRHPRVRQRGRRGGADEDRGHARARDARDVQRGRRAWRTAGG